MNLEKKKKNTENSLQFVRNSVQKKLCTEKKFQILVKEARGTMLRYTEEVVRKLEKPFNFLTGFTAVEFLKNPEFCLTKFTRTLLSH